eukprot:TRINITY_DN50924_c0_g1_i1.p1 TRINITY_DN50924_c0_g1~~TRINITY_DN50924_c0_g1_i1.p1  ORF type:complete len:1360 (+),score=373.71 TRINITY_DN50924_c0_g1_i1:77-4081(+)
MALFPRQEGGHHPQLGALRLETHKRAGSAAPAERSCGRGLAAKQRQRVSNAVAAGARSFRRPLTAVPVGPRSGADLSRVSSTCPGEDAFPAADCAYSGGLPQRADTAVSWLHSQELSIVVGAGAADLLRLRESQHERHEAASTLREQARGQKQVVLGGQQSCGVAALAESGPRLVDSATAAVAPGAAGFSGAPVTPLDPRDWGSEDAMHRLLFQWHRSARDEERSFLSKSVWADAVHRQLQRATQSLPAPNTLRTAAACLLLVKVLSEISDKQAAQSSVRRYEGLQSPSSPRRRRDNAANGPSSGDAADTSGNPERVSELLPPTVAAPLDDEYVRTEKGTLMPVLRNLLNDIFAAVWDGWGVHTHRPFERLLREGDIESVFSPVRLYACVASSVRQELSDWKGSVDGMNAELDRERRRKAAIMQMEVDYWRTQLLKRVFRLWYSEVLAQRRSRNRISSVLARLADKTRHFIKWVAFLRIREYGVCRRAERDQRDHEKCKRDWREEKASLHLERISLKSENVSQQRGFTERVDQLQQENKAVQDECKALVRKYREQMEAAEGRLAACQEELERTRNQRDDWARLSNKMMYELSGYIVGDREEHPYFALITDRPKRRWEREDLRRRVEQLSETCAALAQRAAQAPVDAESARQQERAVKEERRKNAELERLRKQLALLGTDDDDYEVVGEPGSLPEMLAAGNAVERVLLRFCNYMLERSGVLRSSPVENFTSDMQDSEVFIATMAALWPNKCDTEALSEPNQHSRAISVVEGLNRVGLGGMLNIDDILLGRGSRIVVFIGTLFRLYCLSGRDVGLTGRSGAVGRRNLEYEATLTTDDDLWETPADEARRRMPETEAVASVCVTPAIQTLDQQMRRASSAVPAKLGEALNDSPAPSECGDLLTPATRDDDSASEAGAPAGDEEAQAIAAARRKARRKKSKAPQKLRVNYDYAAMLASYRHLSRSNRAWIYLGETVGRELIKRLQSGRTREGDLLDLKSARQMVAFTQLDAERCAELVSEAATAPGDVDEIELAEDVLTACYEDLRRIYQFYTTQEGGRRLSQAGLWHLVKDCKLVKQVSKRDIETCLFRSMEAVQRARTPSVASVSPAGPRGSVVGGHRASVLGGGQRASVVSRSPQKSPSAEQPQVADSLIPPSAFVETLLRMAHIRKGRSGCMTLSRSLQRLLDDHILPNGSRSAVDEFRRTVRHPDVQKVFKRHQRTLSRLFKLYVTTAANEDGDKVLTHEEWLKFIKELRLIDAKLTYADVSNVFVNVMYDETRITLPDAEIGMTYSDFADGLACLAVFKMASPFLPLGMRLDTFFQRVLVPKLRDRLRQGAG